MSNFKQFKEELTTLLVDARKPLIWLETIDWIFIERTIKDITKDSKVIDIDEHVDVWDAASGVRAFNGADAVSSELIHTIDNFLSSRDKKLLIARVPKDAFDKQPQLIALLQNLAYMNYSLTEGKKIDKAKTMMLILPTHTVVEELEPLVERIEIPFPDKEDIWEEFGFNEISQKKKDDLDEDEEPEFTHTPYRFSSSYMSEFENNAEMTIDALLGMHLFEIRNLMQSIQIEGNGQINTFHAQYGDLKSRILAKRKQVVQSTGLLEVIDYDKNYYDKVGNVDGLLEYIGQQKRYLGFSVSENSTDSSSKPKGVLLVGEPGCGKSESAKAIASKLEMPLFRLNMGALLGQYVGQSEHNFMEAIRTAEAAEPCVLWIDEIEKAFSGADKGSNDDKVMTRIIGVFLTWMQERDKLVFLVATANDLSLMKDEFLRKGRWDQIFYLSMPQGDGITAIFKKSLEKYHLKLWDSDEKKVINDLRGSIDWIETARYMKGMSGADISSLVSLTLLDVYGMENPRDVFADMPIPYISEDEEETGAFRLVPIQCIRDNAETLSEQLKKAKEAELDRQINERILQIRIENRVREFDQKTENALKDNLKQLLKPKEWEEKESYYKAKGYISAAEKKNSKSDGASTSSGSSYTRETHYYSNSDSDSSSIYEPSDSFLEYP